MGELDSLPADSEPERSPVKSRSPRPVSVTVTALGVLILAVINLLRFVLAVRLWGFLSGLPHVLPGYQALTGLLWGLLGLVLFAGLWAGWRPALLLLRLGALAYVAYAWFDRLVMTSNGLGENFLFAIAASLATLVWVVWVSTRRRVRTWFGEAYE